MRRAGRDGCLTDRFPQNEKDSKTSSALTSGLMTTTSQCQVWALAQKNERGQRDVVHLEGEMARARTTERRKE